MKRAVLAVALVAGSSGAATAGGYVGLGLGTGPAVNSDQLSDRLVEDGRSGRLILGHRFGRIAFEGAVGKFDLALSIPNSRATVPYDVYQAQLSGKYNLPLGDGFEAFGRIGLHKQWFTTDTSELEASGTGLVLGAGFEYRFGTGIGGMSLFVDYQYSRADMSGDQLDFGATSTRMWTIGATLGF